MKTYGMEGYINRGRVRGEENSATPEDYEESWVVSS